MMLEVRALAELGTFVAIAPVLARVLPRGVGRPVLVLPGFLGDDPSTKPMRVLLRSLGHDAVGWGLGRNIGPTDEILDGLMQLLEDLNTEGHNTNNGQIDVVGWSLGGLYAREMARLAPSAIRQVITLGSPFQIVGEQDSNVSAAFSSFSEFHSDRVAKPRIPSWAREPIPVAATSIYTRGDGIVKWDQCLNRDFPHTENVEVRGSHCGLGHNPAAIIVVADRLAQQGSQWHPFKPPAALRGLFPASEVYDSSRHAA